MVQSLLRWLSSPVRNFCAVVPIVVGGRRVEPVQDGELTARDYEIYYWNPSPGPWY